jgi:ATP adenylyltransferase/5',5'''-P-1,P-4-tetraphosphate phosphorylase II
MDFSEKARALVLEQIGEWDLAGRNYEGLRKASVKTFDFGDYSIDIQFNPERISSSALQNQIQSLEEHNCFLCEANFTAPQRKISFNENFNILVNPFPIFPEHLTIVGVKHQDQQILNNFESMLDLASQLSKFVIYYNGPACGASAPKHLHFQAGLKGFIPIENDFANEICCREVRTIDGVKVSHWPEYQRGIITLTGSNASDLQACFERIYHQLQVFSNVTSEPMLNMIAVYDRKIWTVHIFPRSVYRPSQYFGDGNEQFLISPSSLDMGGLIVTVREEDFFKITEENVFDIFEQVCFDTQSVLTVINKL